MKPIFITPTFAVAPQIATADLESLRNSGFVKVINNRPDGEADDQVPAADMAREADRIGLAYTHLPATKFDLFCDETVEAMSAALAAADGPVLAHCQSGMRSAIVWAAAEARRRPVDTVLGELSAAGFDLDFLRDELDTQAAHDLSIATVGDVVANGQREAA